MFYISVTIHSQIYYLQYIDGSDSLSVVPEAAQASCFVDAPSVVITLVNSRTRKRKTRESTFHLALRLYIIFGLFVRTSNWKCRGCIQVRAINESNVVRMLFAFLGSQTVQLLLGERQRTGCVCVTCSSYIPFIR
ncbi:hypothetical protein K0M31_004265 [Melipona bicolor]|uniref:Uncharacterized protein n=1 Tax=Melipona bicolor TaxID=60889 RepID=A0AA40FWF5_9HYME|nr:hypothetical protein K0M31_004265 [Melipona bicolor]